MSAPKGVIPTTLMLPLPMDRALRMAAGARHTSRAQLIRDILGSWLQNLPKGALSNPPEFAEEGL